ncbi:hypothetical protein Droror1_Dr00002938 [Drosera rotundifolia]
MMGMAEPTKLGDVKENVSSCGGNALVLPWKKLVVKAVDSLIPVMDVESWPDLTDAKGTKTSEVRATRPMEPAANESELPSTTGESHPQGSKNLSSFPHRQCRHYRGGSNRNSTVRSPLPSHMYPIDVLPPYYYPQPYFTPMPSQLYPIDAYYRPIPPPFPLVQNHFVELGRHMPMQPFIPHGHNIDSSRKIPPVTRGNAQLTGSNFLIGASVDPCLNLILHSQQGFGPKNEVLTQENTWRGPGQYLSAPFIHPQASSVGPGFPGAHLQTPPSHSHALPHQVGTLPLEPPHKLDLRDKIVKQIEYYFSDENLAHDAFTKSKMDDQGWVLISIIADYKKLKSLSKDIPFILEALRSSSKIDIQGDKIRKNGNWSAYVSRITNQTSNKQNDVVENVCIEEMIRSLSI